MKENVTINFDNEIAAKHFMSWLSGQGEQDYWEWMMCREQEEDGNITAVSFNYNFYKGEVDTDTSRLDKNR